MRLASWIALVAGLASTGAVGGPGARLYYFPGEFTQTNAAGSPCDTVFVRKGYDAAMRLMGAGGRTAVVHFQNNEKAGFFHGMTLVGLLGGSSDIRVTKKYADGKYRYDVTADGLVDAVALWLEVTVDVRDAQQPGSLICRARGDFSSF